MVIILAWYLTSSFSNNLNKTLLEPNTFPFPISLALLQFGLSCIFSGALFCIMPGKFKCEPLKFTTLKNILIPLGISQIFGSSFDPNQYPAGSGIIYTYCEGLFSSLCNYVVIILWI